MLVIEFRCRCLTFALISRGYNNLLTKNSQIFNLKTITNVSNFSLTYTICLAQTSLYIDSTLWSSQSFLKVNIVVILFSHVSEQNNYRCDSYGKDLSFNSLVNENPLDGKTWNWVKSNKFHQKYWNFQTKTFVADVLTLNCYILLILRYSRFLNCPLTERKLIF